MFTSSCKSNIIAKDPVNIPQAQVAINGVLNRLFIFDKNLNANPSLAIAYKIRLKANFKNS
jgi:hypothetical protein